MSSGPLENLFLILYLSIFNTSATVTGFKKIVFSTGLVFKVTSDLFFICAITFRGLLLKKSLKWLAKTTGSDMDSVSVDKTILDLTFLLLDNSLTTSHAALV